MVVFVKCRRSESKCFFRSYMSLRTAATKTKRKSKSNIVFLCGLQWLCLLSVGDPKVNVFFRSYVFADCGYEDKEKI